MTAGQADAGCPVTACSLEELDFSGQRKQAASQATAAERRARAIGEVTARCGLPGIDTKLRWKPNEFQGEDEKWLEWTTGPSTEGTQWYFDRNVDTCDININRDLT